MILPVVAAIGTIVTLVAECTISVEKEDLKTNAKKPDIDEEETTLVEDD